MERLRLTGVYFKVTAATDGAVPPKVPLFCLAELVDLMRLLFATSYTSKLCLIAAL